MTDATDNAVDHDAVIAFLQGFQEQVCTALADLDGTPFSSDPWTRAEGGGGNTRTLEHAPETAGVFERAGVAFSRITGDALPAAASARRPQLAGRRFLATGVSVVAHPLSPHAPTAHCNLRFFVAETADAPPVWWFGGGFDLTPYYGYQDDARHWHQVAATLCQPFGDAVYPRFKRWCDEYFYLPHRGEPRGIGGLFFDDLDDWGFARCFAFAQAVARGFLEAYLPILKRRADTPFGQRERAFQLYRRGRYAEFNLIHDRGTLFGLQSGGRTESILMSLPPLAAWRYRWQPPENSPEARLYRDFLRPRDWLEP